MVRGKEVYSSKSKANDWPTLSSILCGWGVVQLLLEKGTDTAAASTDGSTPLQTASEIGHHVVVKQLLEKGADVEAANTDGLKPLHLASEKAHDLVAKQLLGIGANTAEANKYIDFAK
jgi:ankyrin repeat protein